MSKGKKVAKRNSVQSNLLDDLNALVTGHNDIVAMHFITRYQGVILGRPLDSTQGGSLDNRVGDNKDETLALL